MTTPPVVCLTECAPSGISTLISEGRYPPYGIAFTKDFVFSLGGGPALYVRMDEWHEIECLQPKMRARCTPYWPGAEEESPGEATFGSANEWTHEREWRMHGSGDPPALRFEPEDVAFLIIGDWVDKNPRYKCVRVDRWTGKIEDPDGAWLPTDGPAHLQAM